MSDCIFRALLFVYVLYTVFIFSTGWTRLLADSGCLQLGVSSLKGGPDYLSIYLSPRSHAADCLCMKVGSNKSYHSMEQYKKSCVRTLTNPLPQHYILPYIDVRGWMGGSASNFVHLGKINQTLKSMTLNTGWDALCRCPLSALFWSARQRRSAWYFVNIRSRVSCTSIFTIC